MGIFEAGLWCAHTLSSQNLGLRAPRPRPEFCSVAEPTNIPPLVHSEPETGQLRQSSAASRTARLARWRLFPFFQVSAGTEAGNWPLEAPLAELCEFMKRKEKNMEQQLQKIPTGLQCVTSSDLFQRRVSIFLEENAPRQGHTPRGRGKHRGFGIRRSQIQTQALPLCALELSTRLLGASVSASAEWEC